MRESDAKNDSLGRDLEDRRSSQGVAVGNPRVSSRVMATTVGRPSVPGPETHLALSVPRVVHFSDGTSRPRARPTATDSGCRVLQNGGGKRTGARVATRAGAGRPKNRWGGHQNGPVRLADRDAPHSETRDWALGSQVAYRHRHRQSDVHSGRADDGSPARISEKVSADAPG